MNYALFIDILNNKILQIQLLYLFNIDQKTFINLTSCKKTSKHSKVIKTLNSRNLNKVSLIKISSINL